MKKVIKRVWEVLEVIIVIYVILMTILFFNNNSYGYSKIGKYTFVNVDKKTSKYVNSEKNSLIIIKEYPKYKKNDSIYYYYVSGDKYIVKNDKIKDIIDTNYYVDDGYSVIDERIIGKQVISLGLVGGFLGCIESKLGFLLFVFGPVLVVFIYQVIEFFRVMKSERKELLEKSNNSTIDADK